jgi:hypothetical protein
MGAQRLSERKTRKVAAVTGLPVIRAWAHGGYVYDFVTAGHLHGWYDLKTGEWGIEATVRTHYNTCPPASVTAGEDALFPGDVVSPLTPAERAAAHQACRPSE